MVRLSIEVSEEIKRGASIFSDDALAKIFERALQINIEKKDMEEALDKLKGLFKNSNMTDEDCLQLGEEVKRDLIKRVKINGNL